MKYVCMAGQMRSGKNVTGEYICSRLGLEQTSFARPVKEIFCRTFGVNMDFVEEWKVRPEPPPGFKKTVRQSLQFIGDGFRSMNPDVWVDYAFENNPPNSCYMDGRYINEISMVKNEGGVNVLIWRPGYENNDSNESEAQIKRLVDWFVENGVRDGLVEGLDYDAGPVGCDLIDYFLINDGDIRSLHSKIDSLLIPDMEAWLTAPPQEGVRSPVA